MHELINKLASSLFRKNSLDECSVEEIESLAKQYTYFSSAQLLLAAKGKESNHPEFEKQVAQASVHITNPLWLDHLLTSKGLTNIKLDELPDKPIILEEPYNDELVVENIKHQPPAPAPQPDPPVIANVEATVTNEAPRFKIEKAEPKNTPLVFDPYHTVDYFASQGIKNIIEEKPKDKLGQQLKSFTEWLKTIRQLPPQEIAALSDNKSEEKVIQLASHSLEDRNVDTETMAEVWIKQGKPEKAIAIYNKLSLLNPSKSGYFASLIENLKNN